MLFRSRKVTIRLHRHGRQLLGMDVLDHHRHQRRGARPAGQRHSGRIMVRDNELLPSDFPRRGTSPFRLLQYSRLPHGRHTCGKIDFDNTSSLCRGKETEFFHAEFITAFTQESPSLWASPMIANIKYCIANIIRQCKLGQIW